MGATAEGMAGETPGKVLRGCFGYTNSSATFGHNGAGGQAGWADPATGISFAFVTNTFAEPRKKRIVALSSLAAAVGVLELSAAAAATGGTVAPRQASAAARL
eukprot:SAG22_NODE_2882_length_2126_cov_2.271337_3_plen_103_part_00